MIRRNTASQVIVLPFLGLTDASAVTTGASLTVVKDGTSGASAGTLTHISGGVWKYAPTQGETDAAIIGLILSATSAIPVVLNLVTTGADTSAVAFGANTTAPATPTNVSDAQTAVLAKLPAALESGRIAAALDSAAILAVADQVWDEATSGHTTAGTYGGRIVRATNSNTEVQITGSNHIAADIHDLQSGVISAGDFAANAITASALAADAVTEIQSGLATSAALATESTKITAIETFATRVTTGLVADGAVYQFTANMLELGPSGTGGDATLAKQNDILAAIQGTEVIQVASPNVLGNLVLTQGDDYDGVANPKASWTVATDYTTGWTVRLTIRDSDDAVVYTNTGSVVSATVVAVTIAAPTGLTMTGCPGQWQGKFDVELTHSSGKKKTIAIGTCYINEDQTR